MIREHQAVTASEKELYDQWLRAIRNHGLFSPEANKVRETLGKMIAERIDTNERK